MVILDGVSCWVRFARVGIKVFVAIPILEAGVSWRMELVDRAQENNDAGRRTTTYSQMKCFFRFIFPRQVEKSVVRSSQLFREHGIPS